MQGKTLAIAERAKPTF